MTYTETIRANIKACEKIVRKARMLGDKNMETHYAAEVRYLRALISAP